MKKKGNRRYSLSASRRAGMNPDRDSSDFWVLTSDFCGGLFVVALVLFSGLTSGGVARAGSFQPRVQIHSTAQVEGATVKLSDFLPPNAPRGLGEICRQVVLGDAPLAASQRVISRVQIEQQLRQFPSTLRQLEIPDQVIVTRKRRRLSSAEILTAIEARMARGEFDGFRTPNLKGLKLAAPVFVTKPDPGLEVRRVDLDPVQRKTRFLLWTSNEPQMLPFYVTIGGLPGPRSPRVTVDKGKSTPQATSFPAVLVAVGKPARLIFETPTVRMMALVTPLESGVQGQLISVRNQDTQRVLKAQVVGAGLVQVRFGEEKGD
jgi:hypothetical protein